MLHRVSWQLTDGRAATPMDTKTQLIP